ncbi:ribonuclease H-like domain-containing protein [Tanacetum coccineum]
MTRSSTNELFTPYKEPEREFRSSRRHFKSLSLDELRSLDFDLFSTQEYSEEEEAKILDSKGVVPTKTAADAKKAIQEMAKYSQKWHNGTSRGRSTKTSDGLAAIQAQLNNLGREIKKVNEKVYAAQVGCEQCKGPHYTKDCPLKEEGKTLEEAYYTQFGGPFQGGGYRATAPGFYQRNNANPSYQERSQSMEDTLSKFMGDTRKTLT